MKSEVELKQGSGDCEAMAAMPLSSLLYRVLAEQAGVSQPCPPVRPASDGWAARASGVIEEIYTDILSFARNDGVQIGRLMPTGNQSYP